MTDGNYKKKNIFQNFANIVTREKKPRIFGM